jgi:hypothetical protein
MEISELPDKLADNEYMLKVYTSPYSDRTPPTGFLSKYTLKGEIPKPFNDWCTVWPSYHHGKHGDYKASDIKRLPITIHVEEFRTGWKIIDFRSGKSQEWAVLLHPLGFTIEVYMNDFIDLIPEIDILKGELQGEFKWQDKRLIKK